MSQGALFDTIIEPRIPPARLRDSFSGIPQKREEQNAINLRAHSSEWLGMWHRRKHTTRQTKLVYLTRTLEFIKIDCLTVCCLFI